MGKTLKNYQIILHGKNPVDVEIVSGEDFTTLYKIFFPRISKVTNILLNSIKEDLLRILRIGSSEIFDMKSIENMKKELQENADKLIEKRMPHIDQETKNVLVSHLVDDMTGLGPIEVLINDPDLEEVVINTSKEHVWVYHKTIGWLKTNITITSEKQIQNYSSIIARRIGRQITTLEPMLDAHLITGDRANATLFPISTKGNTLTIRKFSRRPWTVTDFIANETLNPEVAAFLWLCMQYEMNMIVAGGTSSGKTALLNTLMPFIQPNQRIISIEDTRELQLPKFLHWVPLTTRLPNPEGKGGVSMLNLMINSLRMRPDRIVVGEIRRSEQAEVLFESMHTGHSVYATLHAETAEQVIRRMTNPPINIPHAMMEALHIILVQHRDRRRSIRKTYQVAEVLPLGERADESGVKVNVLYRLKPNGEIAAHDQPIRIFEELGMHTGLTKQELLDDIQEKYNILVWMYKNKINDIER
ncbi:type II/IV secretion system ATPase subunit, partial [Candidatus Aenigmatarchaeota archaeon]